MWLTQRVPLGPPSSQIWLGQSCSTPLSVFVCSQPLWSCKYAVLVTREVVDVPCPASILLNPQVLPLHVYRTRVFERSFLLISLSEMAPHVRCSPFQQPYPLHSFLGTPAPSPSEGIPSVTTHRDKSCARRTVNHSVEIRSISLSLITLMTRARVQVPITIGTHLPKLDPSGTTKNMASSSYPATSRT